MRSIVSHTHPFLYLLLMSLRTALCTNTLVLLMLYNTVKNINQFYLHISVYGLIGLFSLPANTSLVTPTLQYFLARIRKRVSGGSWEMYSYSLPS